MRYHSTYLLALLGASLIPTVSFAAVNGEDCNTDIVQLTRPQGGLVMPTHCVSLLDDVTSASGGPITYDLGLKAPVAGVQVTAVNGLPDAVRFLVGTDNDCTAGTITITTSDIRGGAENNLLGGATSTTLDVDTTAPAGNTAVTINLHDVPIGEFVNLRWATVAGCTGGFDINMVTYEVKR